MGMKREWHHTAVAMPGGCTITEQISGSQPKVGKKPRCPVMQFTTLPAMISCGDQLFSSRSRVWRRFPLENV
jgi:hypothetical protein